MTKKQKIIFLHIPKTAGLSMTEVIANEYKRKNMFYINLLNTQEFIELSLQEKEKIHMVLGHQIFGMHEYFSNDAKYITLLRNPINRVISTYYYIKRRPQNKFYDKIHSENISLKDFVKNDDYFKQVFNGQTKLIAGLDKGIAKKHVSENTYNKAIENLDKHFVVVGLTERFDEYMLMLKNELNWSYPFYVRQNVAKKIEKPAEVSTEIKKIIAEKNEYDIKLYNYVKENYQKKIDKDKKKYEKQLKTFAFLNYIYKPYKISKQTAKKTLKRFRK